MQECRPDWSPDTIHKIENVLTKNYTVFEWGTGYSTIWLAQRVKKVYTMEHNSEWWDKITKIAHELHLHNIEFNLFGLEDKGYYESIHRAEKLDFIIVDGRERMKCFKEAIKVGCYVMLDDSERERYAEAFSYGLSCIDFKPNELGQKATVFQCKN